MAAALPRALAIVLAGALLSADGCREETGEPAATRGEAVSVAPSASSALAAPPAQPQLPPASPPEPPRVDRAAIERAIAQLEGQLRVPAGDADSPWALAHGLLAFGKDFETSDGRSAVLVAASFAELGVRAKGRYGFPVERDGKPVEPHAHLLLKTFLELGLPLDTKLRAADGSAFDLARLLADLRATVALPASDEQWHDSAWWLTSLELGGARGVAEHARIRQAALERLEADDAVLEAKPPGDDPFAADAPMGAAKRAKSHIYGHPCGGLHFVQAVLRVAAGSGSGELRARALRQLALLLQRYDAERVLYAKTVRSHPEARLIVSGQQLKFFGHLLETLALARQLGLLDQDAALARAVDDARRRAAADVLAVLAQLEAEHAYQRLSELGAQRPQLRLDLIGDGCHALHGLRVTLPALPGG